MKSRIDEPILIALPPDLGAQRSISAKAASETFMGLARASMSGEMTSGLIPHLPLPICMYEYVLVSSAQMIESSFRSMDESTIKKRQQQENRTSNSSIQSSNPRTHTSHSSHKWRKKNTHTIISPSPSLSTLHGSAPAGLISLPLSAYLSTLVLHCTPLGTALHASVQSW